MSFTGSLINYDNNNDIFNKKRRSSTKIPLLNNFHNSTRQSNASATTSSANNSANTTPIKNSMGKIGGTSSLNSSITNSILTNANTQHQQHHQQLATTKYMNSKRKYNKYGNMHTGSGGHYQRHHDTNNYLHLNSLWSIWYGVLLTLFQGYLAVHGAYRFLGCSLIPWKIEPVAELNLQIVLCGVVFILLPFFFASAVFKVGNLANDGIKLATGAKERRCSLSPHDGLEEESSGGTLRALWTHGGPTAAFVHIVIAMCLLLPRLLLEARIIENGLLPRENIWHTELDFIAVNRQNLMVLSVVTSPYQNTSSSSSSFNSMEDEDDYYNDTMFTAVSSGDTNAAGGGVGRIVTNSITDNSNSWNSNSNHHNNKYNGKSAKRLETGKTRFLEIPDLINQNNAAEQEEEVENDELGNDNESYEQHGNKPTLVRHSSKEGSAEETFNSNEFVAIKELDMPKTTTQATTTSSKATDNHLLNRNYDEAWDKLGTLDKGTSRQETATASSSTTTSATTTTLTSTIAAAVATQPTGAKTTATSSSSTSSSTIIATGTGSTTSTSHAPTQRSQQHHQHHQQQQQQHHHHSGKTLRKHSRQRQRGHNHRRHHATPAPPSTSNEQQQTARTIDFNQLIFDADLIDINSNNNDQQMLRKASSGESKSTSTVSTTTRDSHIHIVKPELLPEIIPSTPVSKNSKIIEIKTKSKKVKRMANDELQVEIEPEYLIGDLQAMNVASNESSEYIATIEDSSSGSNTKQLKPTENSDYNTNVAATSINAAGGAVIVQLDGFAGMLQIFFGIEKPIDVNVFAHPPSAEFINLLFALLVWCVRYPAVFWSTTKSFATVFSVQMIAAALDIIFSFVGTSNLYKLQVYSEAQPIQQTGLILNGIVTLALFLLSTILIIASSMIMYLYGHGRLAAKMRDRSLITLKSNETWIYFAHCASLCYVLALAVVKAPLLNDLSVTYRSNLHAPTFLSALFSVVHLLLWIVIWLILTAKRRWTFKLPPMDGYGIHKATTQPLLMPQRSSLPSSTGISETSVSAGGGGVGVGHEHKPLNSLGSSIDGTDSPVHGHGNGSVNASATGIGLKGTNSKANDDIYWPKIQPSSPKLKVTFNEVTSTSDDVLLIGDHDNQTDGKRHSPRGTTVCFTSITGEIDDGEYATLRAATAATVVGITMGSGAGGACSSGQQAAAAAGAVNSVKILRLSEYDELPPPPPPVQMLNQQQQQQKQQHDYHTTSPTTTTTNLHINETAQLSSDYANYMGLLGNRGCGGGAGAGAGDDNISEEGKLLECVRDDSVTYASTRDLEPPLPPPLPPPPHADIAENIEQQQHHFQQANHSNDQQTQARNAIMNGHVRAPHAMPEIMQLSSSPEHLVSPLAPVTVTVHTNEAHIAASSQSRCLRRADSGMPNEALTPRSDTTSTNTTESTISPPERAPSETSSGVHSGEERDVEVVIRPRAVCKPPAKLPPQPAIEEEPYGRCTNMRMSSFAVSQGVDSRATGASLAGSAACPTSSATLPLQRSTCNEQRFDYNAHCNTMPLPVGAHSQHYQSQQQQQQQNGNNITYSTPSVTSFKTPTILYANSSVAMAGANAAAQLQQQLQQHLQQQQVPVPTHTTLPNGVRYSNPHFLRRLPHMTKAAESPYGHLGLGAGHHTFSKLLQDPLQCQASSLVNTSIPEDRDSANYSMSSDQDCALYATATQIN